MGADYGKCVEGGGGEHDILWVGKRETLQLGEKWGIYCGVNIKRRNGEKILKLELI